MTVRVGWKLYQRCDDAIGNAVTLVRGADGSLGMHGEMAAAPVGKDGEGGWSYVPRG